MRKISFFLLPLLLLSSCIQLPSPTLDRNFETLEMEQRLAKEGAKAMREQIVLIKNSVEKSASPKLKKMENDINTIKDRLDRLNNVYLSITKDDASYRLGEKGYKVSATDKIDKDLFQELTSGPKDLQERISDVQNTLFELHGSFQYKEAPKLESMSWGDALLWIEWTHLALTTFELRFYQYLHKTANGGILFYDKFDVFSNPRTSTVHVGDEFVTEIGLGTYSTQAQFSVSVNGKTLPQQHEGKVIYKEKVLKEGNNPYRVEFFVTNPQTGEREQMVANFSYYAGK